LDCGHSRRPRSPEALGEREGGFAWTFDHFDWGSGLLSSPREQRVMLQLFRFLSNELKASLVCLGVADALMVTKGTKKIGKPKCALEIGDGDRLGAGVRFDTRKEAEFFSIVEGEYDTAPPRLPSPTRRDRARRSAPTRRALAISSMLTYLDLVRFICVSNTASASCKAPSAAPICGAPLVDQRETGGKVLASATFFATTESILRMRSKARCSSLFRPFRETAPNTSVRLEAPSSCRSGSQMRKVAGAVLPGGSTRVTVAAATLDGLS
jgi:hypothetical protein